MEYSGLVNKYKTNRLLTEEERKDQLKPKVRQKEPHYNLSVIRMNSTFLECVDKYYGFKGILFLVSAFFSCLWLYAPYAIISIYVSQYTNDSPFSWGTAFSSALFPIAISVPMMIGSAWLALRESFTFTHYPIRFNRINRMVYVFRRNGTVLSVPWDEVFFTFGRGNNYANVQNWDIRGHALDKDGVTVRETFALAMDSNSREDLIRHWEFVRRYMEEGPQQLTGQVEIYLPIAERRETFRFGMTRMFANLAAVPILLWMLSPVLVLIGIGRYLAMRTCRVPVWPQEVEQACAIASDDPCINDTRIYAST